jgi:hypothetical protein
MYICAQLSEQGECQVWSEYFGLLPPLSIADALELSAAAFGVWALAWGVRLVVYQFINR